MVAEEKTYSSRVERAPDFASINRVLNEAGAAQTEWFTWAFVRSFGELQILTRASFIMLLVVPLLAGLWPTVKVIVNRYNQSLSVAHEKMTALLGQIPDTQNLLLDAPTTDNLSAGLSGIAEALNTVSVAIADASIQTTALPMVWVVSFGASLCAVLAQTIYQSAAPQIVRSNDKRTYIGKVIEEEKGLRDLEDDKLRELILDTNKEYEGAAQTNRPACFVSVTLYLLAILFIGLIVADQTLSVLDASTLLPNRGIL